ncbi:MAG: alpha/beta hydrolase [Desulfovibrionaceae bacterium]
MQFATASRTWPRLLTWLLIIGLLAALGACAGMPDPTIRRRDALALAASGGFAPLPATPGGVPVCILAHPGPGEDLVVYIEGDGLAYRDRHTPSPDPTPVDPLALRLALLDPAPKRAYLGRPCQYAAPLPAAICPERLWTTARFGPEALAALDTALDQAKTATNARRLHLVGYSGGGAMAVLLAAKRTDVESLVTVAGNLDTAAFSAWHQVTPMTASANPLDAAPAVARLPQAHVVGARDRICPPLLAAHFLDRLGHPPAATRIVLPEAEHHQGLAAAWPTILMRIRRDIAPLPARDDRSLQPIGTRRDASPVLPAAIKRNS